jgi:hypothetical protein
MNVIQILNDGGVLITYPILALLVWIIFLFFVGLKNKSKTERTKTLISAIAWFVIAWGYLGRTIGLIGSFDRVAAVGDISPELLSPGLKMALVGPLVALVSFAIARLAIIVLILVRKS